MPAIIGNPKIKGGILISRLHFVRERQGQAGIDKVLAMLSAGDRATLGGLLFPVAWYPFELNLRLDDAIAQVLSPSDRSKIFVEMGIASANSNLLKHHAIFVKKGDPHHLLSRAPQIYSLYYDKGRREYEKRSDKAAVLRTYEAENVTASDCQTVVGWHHRAIELCGGKDVKVEEKRCRVRGDTCCEYVCEWA